MANDFVDRLDSELSEHCGNYLRVSRYSGEEGVAGWVGWGADFANPGDDIATIIDVMILVMAYWEPDTLYFGDLPWHEQAEIIWGTSGATGGGGVPSHHPFNVP